MRLSLFIVLAGLGAVQGCTTPVNVTKVGPAATPAAIPGMSAGAGAGSVATSADRRSTGAKVEDDNIESKAQKRVDEIYKDTAHVSITAYNHFALITGTTSTEEVKMDIERIVGSIPNVKGIANELVVTKTPVSSIGASDSRITGNVKYRIARNPDLKAERVKVVTDGGVVYLMGLVTRAEADTAADIASTTAGVQKVVRVFEYIN